MQKEEWSEWDERHRRQSCEGSSERVRATSEFQTDLAARTKNFALQIIRLFATLPKTTEAQVIGKQLLRSGTSVGANYREAYRGRSKPEFVAKCGDCLREIEETGYWLDLLVEAHLVAPEKLRPLRQECSELIAIFVTILKRSKQNLS
jgi:four helix bundle protein